MLGTEAGGVQHMCRGFATFEPDKFSYQDKKNIQYLELGQRTQTAVSMNE
jgi:hypothetical protein